MIAHKGKTSLLVCLYHDLDGLAAHLHGNGLWKLVQSEMVGDDGGKIDFAAVDQRHRPGVSVRIHKGAFNGQLLLVHVKQGQIKSGVHLRHAEQQDGAALSRELEGTLYSGNISHTLNHHIGMASHCLAEAFLPAGLGRVDGAVSSQLKGSLAAFFIRLAEDDFRRAGKLGQLHHD